MKEKYSRSGQWHGWNLSRDMTCIKLEACFGPCIACVSLAYGAVYVDAFRMWMDGTAICVAVGPRASMYGDVRCHKDHSHCVQRRIFLARTWAYGDVAVCPRACEENANLLKAGNRALGVCWVYNATCNTPPAPHQPPLQWPSATARRHHSRRRRCILQHRLTTATWYAGQWLPVVVLNVALIALPLITLGETLFVDVTHGI